jgi:hypothetical protein
MAKVSFNYNLEKDAKSWVEIAQDRNDFYGVSYNKQVDFIPDDLLKLIQKNSKEKAINLIIKHLKNHSKKKLRKDLINKTINSINDLWGNIELKYFQKLEKITQKPIYVSNFRCYITTGFMCPYSEKDNSFFISIWHSLSSSIATIAHEILHLQFLYYYKKTCLAYLNEKETDMLKEALTFLLNVEFGKLLLTEDQGYPTHEKIRSKLEKLWNKDKNFEKFLKEIITNKQNYFK